jgi:hypothetical protein
MPSTRTSNDCAVAQGRRGSSPRAGKDRAARGWGTFERPPPRVPTGCNGSRRGIRRRDQVARKRRAQSRGEARPRVVAASLGVRTCNDRDAHAGKARAQQKSCTAQSLPFGLCRSTSMHARRQMPACWLGHTGRPTRSIGLKHAQPRPPELSDIRPPNWLEPG